MIMKKNWLFKLLRNKDFIWFIAALIMLVIAFVIHRWLTFDISLVVSIIVLYICTAVSRLIYNKASSWKEDSNKLSEDYDSICRRYLLENELWEPVYRLSQSHHLIIKERNFLQQTNCIRQQLMQLIGRYSSPVSKENT